MGSQVEYHDVVILGAGLSGINTAHVFREKIPHRKLTILEARSEIGGTWTFWKYPGFRSDSSLNTFGLQWHPWPHKSKVGAAEDIAAYLKDAADTDGITGLVRLRHRVVQAEWKTEENMWTLQVDVHGEGRKIFKANFVVTCTGYYSYEKAFPVEIPGLEDFGGEVVHPQWWPEDLDIAGKRIVVVGSGATTITIFPHLAKEAKQLTMLQRSPAYVVAIPTSSAVDNLLHWLLPLSWAHRICHIKDLVFEVFISQLMLNYPSVGRFLLNKEIKKNAPPDIDVDVHFNPRYGPFQQRLGMCPNGDFFKALGRENCEIVTDTIQTVTKDGIELRSGRKLPADMIITATGLYFELLGGLLPTVDGQKIDVGSHYAWRGCMLESLPNMAFVMGYVTQSWTPGASVMAYVVARVLEQMEKESAAKVVPVIERTPDMAAELPCPTEANYFLKAADRMPKVTNKGPWYGRLNLMKDLWARYFGSMTDGLQYTGSAKSKTV